MSSPGVQIHERTCVSHVTIQKGRVTGVETDRGRIQCDYFVNCAGQVQLLNFFLSCFRCWRICSLPSVSLFIFLLGFNDLCFGLVYWSKSSHVTHQLIPAGVWRRKSSACHLLCTKGWVLTCWAVYLQFLVQLCPWCLCWEIHSSDRMNFVLAVSETAPSLSLPSPKIYLLFTP